MFVAAKTEDSFVAAKLLDFVAAAELSPTFSFSNCKGQIVAVKKQICSYKHGFADANVNRVATILLKLPQRPATSDDSKGEKERKAFTVCQLVIRSSKRIDFVWARLGHFGTTWITTFCLETGGLTRQLIHSKAVCMLYGVYLMSGSYFLRINCTERLSKVSPYFAGYITAV